MGLKDLARSRFAEWTGQNWTSVHYSAIAAEAFSTTPAEDVGLRDIILNTIAEHNSLVDKAEWQEVILENEQLSRKLLCLFAGRLTRSTDIIEDQRRRIAILEIERDEQSTQFSASTNSMNEIAQCRYCSINFDIVFERADATLRCRSCRTRHHYQDSSEPRERSDETQAAVIPSLL